jgi:hypothetical protein
MAKERINPEFNIQRVTQPTANPVDIYYRTELGQPDPSRQLQIVEALKELNPQLQRLTSDAMAAMIAKEQDIGAIEAAQDDEATIRRKQAEYVEKSGGLAPWRYQSFLENAGARLIRDKYQNAMYSQLEDLSNPFNADGTLRDPSYVKAKMDEMYQQAAIPENSFFMIRGAAKAKAAVDESILSRVEQMRVQKVKEATEKDLEDNIASILETTPDSELFDALQPGGSIAKLKDNFYNNGYGSGDQQLISAVSNRIDGLIAENKFDEARALVGLMMRSPAAGRALGARNLPALKKKLAEIDEREDQHDQMRFSREDRVFAREDRAFARAARTTAKYAADLSSQVRTKIVEMSAETGFVSLSTPQITEMVQNTAQDLGIPQDEMPVLLGDAVERGRATVASINAPLPTNPQAYQDISTQVKDMDPVAAKLLVDMFQGFGSITPTQAASIVKEIDNRNQLPTFFDQTVESSLQSLSNGTWSGYDLSEFDPEYRNTLLNIGIDAKDSIRDSLMEWASLPENRQAAQDDPEKFKISLKAEARRLMKEASDSLRTQHSDSLQSHNRRTGFEYIDKSANLTGSLENFITDAVSDLGVESKADASMLIARTSKKARELLRQEYLNAPANMTATEKAEYLRDKTTEIADQVIREMKSKDSDLLPPSLRNTVQAAMQNVQVPAPEGIRDIEGQAVPPAIQGETWFSTNAATQQELDLYTAGQEIGEKFPAGSVTGQSDPKTKAAYAEAKAKVQTAASTLIKEMVQLKSGDYRSSMRESERDQVWWASGDRPAFVIRDDGLYTLPNNPAGESPTRATRRNMSIPEMQAAAAFGDRTPDKYTELDRNATAKYWAAKSLIGYTADEVRNGKTAEGLTISENYRDPNTFLYFQTPEEYQKAVIEYNESNGKSGYIAEYILPNLPGITEDVFSEAQSALLIKRK